MDKPWKTVAELLGNRPDVFRIAPEASVLSALEKLAEKDVGALIVCDGRKSGRHRHRARLCPKGRTARPHGSGHEGPGHYDGGRAFTCLRLTPSINAWR